MKKNALYQIYKEVKRREQEIVNGDADVTKSVNHTKGFLECLFYMKEITVEEQISLEDNIEGLYLEIEDKKKERQK